MFTFTDEERAVVTEFGSITTDEQGHEVLLGLTLEETAFYMSYAKRRPTVPDRDAQKRYRALDKKHELARLNSINSGVPLRNEHQSRP